MFQITLGLGSNIAEREENLNNAINLMQQRQIISEVTQSKIIRSKALLPKDAPLDWDLEFLNMAILAFTSLTPEQLLTQIKQIEKDLGREDRGFWGPREIDIDILTYGI